MKTNIVFLLLAFVVMFSATQASGKTKQKPSELVKVDTVLVVGENQYAFCTLTSKCTYAQIVYWAESNNFKLCGEDGKVVADQMTGNEVLLPAPPEKLKRLDGKLWIPALAEDGTIRHWPDTQVFGGHWFTNAPYNVLLKISVEPSIVQR